MSGGFFNRFSPWGGDRGGRNQQPGGHQGPGRGGNHPERRPHGLGGSRRGVSFEDDGDYDLADDGREYGGGRYSHRRGLSDSEYKACRTSIFNPEGYLNDGGRGGGEPMPPAPPVWQGQQSMGLPTAAHPQGPHDQYGLPAAPGPLGGGVLAHPAAPMPLAPGTQQGGAPRAPGTQQGGAPLAPQAPGTQQGGAQIAVQPPGGGGAGPPQAPPTGMGANVPSTQEGSSIAGALERLTSCMTDADTSRSLRWQ